METLEQLRNFWQNHQDAQSASLNKQDVDRVIKSRIIKEKKGIAEYFWVSLAFQIILYSFASHIIVKFWSDSRIAMLCVAGVVMYIPFTIILFRKIRKMFEPRADLATDIRTGVSNQYQLLSDFFRFKKRFDLVSIPVNSFILVIVLFTLYVPGSIEGNLAEGVVSFVLLVLMYAIGAWFENRKHFIRPLKQFESIINDLEKN